MRKIIKHHIEGGTWESHPRVHDLQYPRLGKPRRGLQILDTWMGFPRPSLNVVLDSINLNPEKFERLQSQWGYILTLFGFCMFIVHFRLK